ncbi:MAG: hypothetical protein RLZZ127_1237 [Planctomycetota bacterium]
MSRILPLSRTLCACAVLGATAAAEPNLAPPPGWKPGLREPTAAELEAARASARQVVTVYPNQRALDLLRQQEPDADLSLVEAQLRPDGQTLVTTGMDPVGSQDPTASQDKTASTPQAAPVPTGPLPRWVDNSTDSAFPQIVSQGSIGGCAGYAIAYYANTFAYARSRGVDARYTALHQTSPLFIYAFENNGSDSGSYSSGIFNKMSAFGNMSFARRPSQSDYTGWPTSAADWRDALSRRVAIWGSLGDMRDTSVQSKAKQMLANGSLLTFGCYVNGFRYRQIKNNPVTSRDDGTVGQLAVAWAVKNADGHEMTLVGYDDDLWIDCNDDGVMQAAELGAWKVANSWGGWANDGFVWLAYDAVHLTSKIPGFAPAERESCFQKITSPFFLPEAAWQEVVAAEPPSLLAEVAFTVADRSRMRFRAQRLDPVTGTAAASIDLSTINNAMANQSQGLNWSGGTGTAPGLMVLDLSTLVRDGDWIYAVEAWDASSSDTGRPVLTAVRFTDGLGTPAVETVDPRGAAAWPVALGSAAGGQIRRTAADTIPPAATNDLTVSWFRYNTSSRSGDQLLFSVSWTSAGDDGTAGTPAGYEVRYALNPITEATWPSATAAIAPAVVPGGGVVTTSPITITPGSPCYVAVRTVDDAGNRSGLSNMLTVDPPRYAVAPATLPAAQEGELFSVDLELQPVVEGTTWSTVSLPPLIPAPPAWLNLDPVTGVLSGTPAETDVGTFTFSVVAKNLNAYPTIQVIQSMTLTVDASGNRRPRISASAAATPVDLALP